MKNNHSIYEKVKNTQDLSSTPIQSSYWIIPGRFRAGEHPGFEAETDQEIKAKLGWLLGAGVNTIIDLTQDKDTLQKYRKSIKAVASESGKKLTHYHFPIQDWTTPTVAKMVEILDAIEGELNVGNIVYLHCGGGKGRTGTVVGCYLVRRGVTGEEALKTIQELRRGIPGDAESPETDEQQRMVLGWKQGQ